MAVGGLGPTLIHEHVFVLTPNVMQSYGHEWRWDVLPALREHGVDEAQITAMLVHNPARYFTGGRIEPNGSYRDSPHAQPLPASGCSG
jgi:predicted metal-dependent phosphotriesterase family hydrolase